MEEKILSLQNIETIGYILTNMYDQIERYCYDYKEMRRMLDDEAIVQSFYNSGLLGESIKDKFDTVYSLLTSFLESTEVLKSNTKNYLESQEAANNGR